MPGNSSQQPFERGSPGISVQGPPAAFPPGEFPDQPRVIAATQRYAVVDKPSGMLSVPGKGSGKADCVVARVAAIFPGAAGPLVVHRLDMETSGLLVFGLDEESQRDLSAQFEERSVEKSYIALLTAELSRAWEGPDPLRDEHGELALPLRGDLDRRPLQVVDPENGRESVTRWRIIGREVDRVRVRFEPLTGRTHQLRVHAASGLGHPIIGDELYGAPEADRLMLHAATLSFLEPGTRRRVEFASPAPF